MSAGTASWTELPVEIGAGELERWLPRLAQPVAVTGATGFVGSHLVEALVRGGVRPRVAVRHRSRLLPDLAGVVDCIDCHLADGGSLARLVTGCGTVLHLAGVVRAPSEADFQRANAAGTAALVAACAAAAQPPRLVHVSSLAATGPSDAPAGRGPEEQPRPVSAYGRSKLAGERAVGGYGARWVIVRPPAVYGPRDIDILQFFRLAARGLVPLPAGERWVTLAHVADVVRSVLAAAAGELWGRVLHVGDPTPRPMTDVVAVVAEAGGVRARTVAVPPAVLRVAGRCGDGLQRLGFRKVALTSDKSAELLARHWTARTADSLAALGIGGAISLPQGARATWQWYREKGWVPRE